MGEGKERSLFDEEDAATPHASTAGLFAEIVFNRPLDHPYTYAVPEHLESAMAVGKRVLAPFGKGERREVGFCVGIGNQTPSRNVKEIVDVLDDEPLLTPDLMRLTRWMADYYLCGWGQVLSAVIPSAARDKAGSREVVFVEALNIDPPTTLSPKQQRVWEILTKTTGGLPIPELARKAGCGTGPIQALVRAGLVRKVTRRVELYRETVEEVDESRSVDLNADQVRVWAPLQEAIRRGGFRAFLLHGVTGSGKTEIYLRAIEEVLQQGKEAIVLVPEISLTPQTIERFRGRCGKVAVVHSNLRPAERGWHWRRIAAGEVHVVVGARSAVFAPTRRLGLIVIDEEHENSFKQDSTPRYHARDVAVMRARLEGIPIILGSATPSLESWHNAQRGQYTLLSLPNRVEDRSLPDVTLIDLRYEPPRGSRYQAISTALERAMRQSLQAGGQVILLLNRRGYSTHLQCPGCGQVETCRFCDVALTYHRERDVALCHYCGYEKSPPVRCQQCGFAHIRYQGIGVEKLQAEVEQKFPHFVIRRMDSDTMKKPGSHERVLSAFRQGLVHVLLGTQMIAKGLDFPNVTLVGVVNADVALHLPDFRSAERTFQLLAQVAGRAGRGPSGGRVLIQTFNPQHPCIALAARHDYLSFVKAELAIRKAHQYPPYQRLVRLIVRSLDQEKAAHFADQLAGRFHIALTALQSSGAQPANIRLLGPAEAPVFRLKNFFRYHFQLQSSSPGALHQLLRSVLPTVRLPAGVEYIVDVDPISLL
ncbi:MAG: primosomal protein N' [Gemmatales bacterium]|nr:MAG: primosomal protein N' [Gemmatales bacterium]